MALKDLFPRTIPIERRVTPRDPQKTYKKIELEMLIGKPVICLSNEIENLVVGIGKEITYVTQAQQPMLIVHNIVSDKDILPLGTLFAYTKQKFDALNQIEPNARIALFYNRLDYQEVDKKFTQKEAIIASDEWAAVITAYLKTFLKV